MKEGDASEGLPAQYIVAVVPLSWWQLKRRIRRAASPNSSERNPVLLAPERREIEVVVGGVEEVEAAGEVGISVMDGALGLFRAAGS